MVANAGRFVLLMAFLFPWLGVSPFKPLMQASVTVTQVSPQVCPSAGCAAGQRINFKTDYGLASFDPTEVYNIQVCVYTPINWSVTSDSFEMSYVGGVTGSTYQNSISYCESAIENYNISGGRIGYAAAEDVGDSLTFNFRLGISASLPGALMIRVRVLDTSGNWIQIGQGLTSLSIAATASQVYVANDAASCSVNSPCYINSGDDVLSGYGTGLKDALDAAPAPANVNILGNYQIKSNAVAVNQAHTIQGSNNATITYSGTDCSQAMLNISAGVTIKNLTINDGSCSTTNRNLIAISSASKVTIESNDLTGGQDAVYLTTSNTAAVDLRYNDITSNSGYGIYSTSGNAGVVDAVANNIFSNRSGTQVVCTSLTKGVMDHNYWGAGVLPSTATLNCTSDASKRLGAPIEHNLTGPGVSVQRVTVSASLTYAFNNQIGYQHSTGATDFGLFIVNHGYGTVENIPFTSSQPSNLSACSNYWDVFFADATLPDAATTLNLYFKYDTSPSCINTVESSVYCGQTTDPSIYPLYWYDLGTSNWITTGRTPGGQDTTCLMASNEIKVTIDQIDGRPSFQDMQHLPYVVALPGQQNAVLLTSFTASPGNNSAYIRWTTAYEIGVYAFAVTRSTTVNGTYIEVGPRFQPLGSSVQGGSYQYIDTGLTNGSTYYYRLKIINYDLSYSLSGPVSVVPVPPTITPSPTRTITRTRTITPITPTVTRTRTLWPTSTYLFKTPTRTVTATITPTSPFRTITTTLTATVTRQITPTILGSVSPSVEAATELAYQRASRTAAAKTGIALTATPTPQPGGNTSPFTVTLVVLAAAAVAGGAFLWLRDRKSGI